MTEAIIFKGKYETITLRQHRHKAERLYQCLADCLQPKVDSVRFMETNEYDQPGEKITLAPSAWSVIRWVPIGS